MARRPGEAAGPGRAPGRAHGAGSATADSCPSCDNEVLADVRYKRTIVRIMRTPRGQVQDWLFPRVRRAVLTLLMVDSDKRWHLREVVRRADCAIGTVRRELKGLVACGVVIESRDGNRTYYQANPQCPVFAELSSLIRKTSGLADVLRAALAKLSERIGSVSDQEVREIIQAAKTLRSQVEAWIRATHPELL